MIKIRKLQKSDLKIRVEWMNNPKVNSTMHFSLPITLEGTQVWYNKIRQDNNRSDFAFEDKNGKTIAMGGLVTIDHQIKKAELYIFVEPNNHSKGYGYESTKLLCKYGFEQLGLHKIYLYTNENNIPARRIYEKIGFRLEGFMRDEYTVNSHYGNRLYYGLLETDFKKDNLYKVNNFIKISQTNIKGKEILIVRDDIFPEIGGGNKARKAFYYESYLKNNGYNAVVTCGGVQSNHNRAIALMAARNHWKCILCVQDTKNRFYNENGNALLDRMSGAEIEIISPEDTSKAMDKAIQKLKDEGYNPYYIHGGGHDLPGGIAYVEAVSLLKEKCVNLGYKPDYIFHASGTGSTQAGLLVGLEKVGWSDVKVIGISVARQYERGKEAIIDFVNKLSYYYGMDVKIDNKVLFNTDYLYGGYEKYSQEMKTFLTKVYKDNGILFDTTYSGKALYGMFDIIKKENLQSKKILFWHTGGIMNLMK